MRARLRASCVVVGLLAGCIDADANGASADQFASSAMRPVILRVEYVGSSIKRRHLVKKSGVQPGDAANPRHIEAGRSRLEAYFRGKGFENAKVAVEKAGVQGVSVSYQIDAGR